MLMKAHLTRRKDIPISLAKHWNDEPNRYQEPKGNEIIGVSYGNVLVPSKLHQWTIQYRPDKNRIRGGVIGNALEDSKEILSRHPKIGTLSNRITLYHRF